MEADFRRLFAVRNVLDSLAVPWVFAGGWAIDLFVDRVTRAHKDIDIAVRRCDQGVVQTYLTERGWRLEVAHAGRLSSWLPGEVIALPRHGVWATRPGADPDFLELLLNEADANEFRFRRDQSITLAMSAAFTRAANGLPMLAPEIALLYKSAHADEADNRADFQVARPALTAARRQWLRDALTRTRPDHPWMAELS